MNGPHKSETHRGLCSADVSALLLFVFVVAESSLAVASPARPTATAHRVSGEVAKSVRVDGHLLEAVWSSIPGDDRFTQQYPNELTAPSEPTTFRVFFDSEALYVGITCTQSTVPVVAVLGRRDRVAPGDRVTVDIASRDDRTTAAHFGISAGGVLDDGIYFNDGDYSANWDENWEAATAVNETGWTAEFRIPFRILRIDAGATQTWGFQIQRFIGPRNEWDLWSYRARSAAGVVSTFGTLNGLDGVAPVRAWEFRPSILGKLRHRDSASRSAVARAADGTGSLGLDVRTHPTTGTTLDLAFNPDFGQVEADQVVLNLSNYEIVFPEKRPFFLEGVDVFGTPRSVLYTRRIGAKPGDPTLDPLASETVVEPADPSRIWAAGKWVGALGKGSSVGVLSALVGENDVGVQRAPRFSQGQVLTYKRPVSPTTLFNVVRVQQRLGAQTDLGFIAITTNRGEHAERYPRLGFRCPALDGADANGGAPVAERCFNDAYVAAGDLRWRSPAANYSVTGQMISSILAGGPPRPSSDGVPVAPGQLGLGGTLTLAKQGGRHWLGTLSQTWSDRHLDYNDLGYLDRKNDAATYANLTYRTVEPWGPTVDTAVTLALSHRQTADTLSQGIGAGLRLEDNLRLSGNATLRNFWEVALTGYLRGARYDDRETGDGVALERARLFGGELWFGSDGRRRVSGAGWGQWQRVQVGSQVQISGNLTVRPTAWLDFDLAPSFLHAEGEPRFLAKDASSRQYYFGRLRADNIGATARANVGLTTRLTLQFYAQLFLAMKHYEAPSVADTNGVPRARIALESLQPLSQLPPEIANPDSQSSVLNVNAVLRWELRLGSVLYLVYSRAQEPGWTANGAQLPSLQVVPLWGNRGGVDTLLFKIAYWRG